MEETVKFNDPFHQMICPKCQQTIRHLKHTMTCGCGSKIKGTRKNNKLKS